MKPELTAFPFTKMHGLGNDFIILNNLAKQLPIADLPVAQLSHRHVGVGFDQMLVIEPSARADYFCRIFNADGCEAEQCANGLRCVARFLHETKLCARREFQLETVSGVYLLEVPNYEQIRITMAAPIIQAKLTSLNLKQSACAIDLSIVSMGNPHAIIQVPSIDSSLLPQWVPEISHQACFPQGVNVGFMHVISRAHIRLRTFERGTGETLACGSNACAAAAAGIINGWLQSTVKVEFRFGEIFIDWAGHDAPMHMVGPAAHVYSGQLTI